MTPDTPPSPLCPSPLGPPGPPGPPSEARRQILHCRTLREQGVSAAEATERCRPGGPWRMLLPGVYLLGQGPPTSEERLCAALLYAAGQPIPAQAGPDRCPAPVPPAPSAPEAQITGLAALALHGFATAPSLPALEHLDVLLPRVRRLRSSGFARIVRAQVMPRAEQITGLPVAPVARALADAVAGLTDPVAGLPDAALARRLLTEAVRGRRCEAAAAVRELDRAGLLELPRVAEAVENLLVEDRADAEGDLYALVRLHRLPDPCWNVGLRLPGGPVLGTLDAYWPEEAVAVEITRTPLPGQEARRAEHARRREVLERLGITVLALTPEKLRTSPRQQAAVVRTALMAADDREPPAYVMVLPH
ncbi:hypothetical protein LHJ74_11285 [Streptomyces sp. N2-109]|uniref:DUF559 domain-containing protein n=1 Tax=Streptomyces gossypii TaxID=2883101 RepID=A0ABT2JSZ8_9ACTN|nr:hypothetical protein [Streptomyces gossypii]MCT2590485.1 hypothetical protein [Streptomyces gossypii]